MLKKLCGCLLLYFCFGLSYFYGALLINYKTNLLITGRSTTSWILVWFHKMRVNDCFQGLIKLCWKKLQ
ncbi:hypothetical protein evm_011719 [Chilo suppressalis]|nr:hypothetical protein evm_011719 [Chilo suppressalis]